MDIEYWEKEIQDHGETAALASAITDLREDSMLEHPWFFDPTNGSRGVVLARVLAGAYKVSFFGYPYVRVLCPSDMRDLRFFLLKEEMEKYAKENMPHPTAIREP